MTPASAIHWLEQGPGARWVRSGCLLLALGLLSFVVAHRQFQGPQTEETLRQAVLARQLAHGQGFSTLVRYPQAEAWLALHDGTPGAANAGPELYHPPGYALALAAGLAVLPEAVLFADRVAPPNGWNADYLLLGLNVVLFWIAAGQTWRLGRRLIDDRAGLLAAVALLLSAPVWRQVVAVNGTPLPMVLLLALVSSLLRADECRAAGRRAWTWWLAAGVASGALFLTDYVWAAIVPVLVGYAWWRQRSAGLLVLAAVLTVATPWLLRNVALTGHPLALAAQDLGLREGDALAEPSTARATLAAELPPVPWTKVGRKAAVALDETVRQGVWAGGGLVLTAFFVASWLYRFLSDEVNRWRGAVTLLVLGLAVVQGTTNSGEGERLIVTVAAPLLILIGTGFFLVLLRSWDGSPARTGIAVAILLVLQAAPLLHDLAAPRRIHFTYPPYHPPLLHALRAELLRRGGEQPSWMADTPAGAAWYTGTRVWAPPRQLRDFYRIHADEPLVALLLTPVTLDRPFFSELTARPPAEPSRFGDWERIYRALGQDQLPRDFPLGRVERIAPNYLVLLDAQRLPWRGISVAPEGGRALRPPGLTP